MTPASPDPPLPGRRVSSREVVFLLAGTIIGAGLTALVVLAFHFISQADIARYPPRPPDGAHENLVSPPAEPVEDVSFRPIASPESGGAAQLEIRLTMRDGELAVVAGGTRVGEEGDDVGAVLDALRRRVARFANAAAASAEGDEEPSVKLHPAPTVPNDVFVRVVDACLAGGVTNVTFVDEPAKIGK